MMTSASLSIDRSGGEQVVRPPQPTDGVGAALRDVYPAEGALPREFTALIGRLNQQRRPH